MDAIPILFLVCLLFLLAFATKQDRAALWIVTISNVVGWLLVLFVTRQIHAPWKLAIPGTGETLTIISLLYWGRNRSAFIQAALLLIAWCAHVQCYLDLIWNTNVVYDHYEQIIAAVAIAQLIGFHDTFAHCFRSVRNWFRGAGRGRVRAASGGVSALRVPGDPLL